MEFAKAIAKRYPYLFDKENNLWIDFIGIIFFSSLLILLFFYSI